MRTIHRALLSFAVAALLPAAASAEAEAFPTRQIEMIVPYSAGSGVDLLARTFAHALESQLKVPFVVQDREGATGIIGSSAVARSAPDGYTIMANASPPFAVAALSQKQPPYDVRSAFAPIARIGSVPLVLITSADSPIKSLADLRAQAKAHPDQGTYASTGDGSPGQLYMELVKSSTGIRLTEVPYKSSTQALVDVIGGRIMASLVSLPAAEQLIKQGRLRVLAVGSKERLKRFPDTPTLAEALSMPGMEANVWYGFLAPAKVPPERIEQLYRAVSAVFATTEARDSMGTLGIVPELQSPKEFAASLERDTETARRMLTLVEKSRTTQ